MSSSSSTSHSRGAHHRGAHGGGGGGDSHDGGGGGGGGGGKLVKVAFARTQAEAEMMQGLLQDDGIPSILKRTRGFDNPDFLASGPHDVLVNADHAKKAREVLEGTMIESEDEVRAEYGEEARLARDGTATPAARLALWLIVAVLGAAILVWILYQLT
jgi:hypothetical protein